MTAEQSQTQAHADRGSNRSQRPESAAFREFIGAQWAPRAAADSPRAEVADFAAVRRQRLSELFPGERLVLPAGGLKVRSNDTDYRFRPHSAFAHMTGMGTDEEPDAVLVLHPGADEPGTDPHAPGHEAVLYLRPLASRESEEFWADARYGEFWVGARPTLVEVEERLGIRCAHIDELVDAIGKDLGQVQLRVVPGADEAISAAVTQLRAQNQVALDSTADQDAQLAEQLSELRLRKDEWEISQMRQAVAATISGFGEIARALPRAIAHHRGERVIEGAFAATAREEGNGLGYETIAAAGNHATTLHWIRNHGRVQEGDLVLVDAGVEVDSLYTADITRTMPTAGTFSPVQRRVYQAVLDAADAAFAYARPGVKFRDVHTAAMEVLADRLQQWGLLPVSAAEALSPQGQHHRRWMPHGTSHHLGLDVHDCAQARRQMYLDAELEEGMVFTIEPGLYFKQDDLAIPEQLRGIGVRIEDDVLVTADGVENLSAALPRHPDAVEQWLADQQSGESARPTQ